MMGLISRVIGTFAGGGGSAFLSGQANVANEKRRFQAAISLMKTGGSRYIEDEEMIDVFDQPDAIPLYALTPEEAHAFEFGVLPRTGGAPGAVAELFDAGQLPGIIKESTAEYNREKSELEARGAQASADIAKYGLKEAQSRSQIRSSEAATQKFDEERRKFEAEKNAFIKAESQFEAESDAGTKHALELEKAEASIIQAQSRVEETLAETAIEQRKVAESLALAEQGFSARQKEAAAGIAASQEAEKIARGRVLKAEEGTALAIERKAESDRRKAAAQFKEARQSKRGTATTGRRQRKSKFALGIQPSSGFTGGNIVQQSLLGA